MKHLFSCHFKHLWKKPEYYCNISVGSINGTAKNTGCFDLKMFRNCPIRIEIITGSHIFRDRPFNLKGGGYGFLFRSEIIFRTTQELEYLSILSRKARIFFPEFNIRLYDQNQNIFFSNIGNQNIFLEKNHNLQVKWSFPYIVFTTDCHFMPSF